MSQGNSILDNLQWDADSGTITFKDVRYMLIRPDTVVDFQKAVEAEVGSEKCAQMRASQYPGHTRFGVHGPGRLGGHWPLLRHLPRQSSSQAEPHRGLAPRVGQRIQLTGMEV